MNNIAYIIDCRIIDSNDPMIDHLFNSSQEACDYIIIHKFRGNSYYDNMTVDQLQIEARKYVIEYPIP